MEGGSCSTNNINSSSSCLMMMGFGGGGGGGNLQHHSNNGSGGGLCPMMIMPPPSPSQNVPDHHHHHHNNLGVFLNNQSQNQNQNQNQNRLHNFATSCSTMMAPNQEQDHNLPNSNTNLITGCFFMDNNNNSVDHNNNNNSIAVGDGVSSSVKAKIMSHPHYHRLLAAYVNCQKIGAPPEVVTRLEEACAAAAASGRTGTGCIGEDPALDQFMEAYCEMLSKYEQELSKPFKEAMLFLSRIECQFKSLSLSSPDSAAAAAGGGGGACGDGMDRNGSSEEEADLNNSFIDPQAEDRELKGQLLRKYSGYLGSLKQEFMKKRKKGKLPKEARQQLLEWWSRHYKWPYPSESQKIALAESTGLDQKQINNWFINQRKRHWKPSEDMQFVVMDAHPHHYYMESVLGNPFPMDITPTLL